MPRSIQDGTMRTRPSRLGGDSGNALVVALLVLMLFTAAGVTFVAVTKSEKQIAGNQMAGTQALYSAEAGISEAVNRMNDPGDVTNYIGPLAPAPGWGRYLVLQSGNGALDPGVAGLASDGLDNNGNAQVDEAGERYNEVLSKQPVSIGAPRYPLVRVEYRVRSGKLVRFGDADQNAATPPAENLVIGAPVLRVTALGQRGTANKVLEAEAVRYPFIDVNSAFWAGGPVKLNGNAFLIDGYDHSMVAPYDTIPGAAPRPAILTEGPTSDVPLSLSQQDNVSGEGGEGSIAQSVYQYDFNQILAMAGQLVDYKLPGGTALSSSDAPLGTLAAPKMTVVDGNLKISGTWTGAGVLVVNGNLAMTGGCQFSGIVVCLGDLDFTGGGPADVAHIIGGLIMQGTVIDDSKVAGAGRIFYSSGAVNNALTVGNYNLSMWRER